MRFVRKSRREDGKEGGEHQPEKTKTMRERKDMRRDPQQAVLASLELNN